MPIPIGAIAAYPLSAVASPDSKTWLLCDGSERPRYEQQGSGVDTPLFAAIGTVFGTGDTHTTFNVPDLRGVFVRGSDRSPSQGAANRDSGPRVEVGSFVIGSYEADSVGPHSHPLSQNWGTMMDGSTSISVKATSSGSPLDPSSSAQTLVNHADPPANLSETRPANTAMTFIIMAEGTVNSPPVGSVLYWGGVQDPTPAGEERWCICDGRVVQTPGGFITLPDLRGQFLRGATSATDPAVGSIVLDSMMQHWHPLSGSAWIRQYGGGSTQAMGAPGEGGGCGDTDLTGWNVAPESRPRNVALHHITRVS